MQKHINLNCECCVINKLDLPFSLEVLVLLVKMVKTLELSMKGCVRECVLMRAHTHTNIFLGSVSYLSVYLSSEDQCG